MKQADGEAACREYWREIGERPIRAWEEAAPLLRDYVAMLLQGSRVRNLLSRAQRTEAAIWVHIYDSLRAVGVIADARPGLILDIGSGNGLPGVPLAMALPESRFLLLERSRGKSDFLQMVAARLGLENARIRNGEMSKALLQDEAPGLALLRAVVRPEPDRVPHWLRAMECPWVVYATPNNEAVWLALAETCGYSLEVKQEYKLPEIDSQRVLLKFLKL